MGSFFEMTGAEVEAALGTADARFARRHALLVLSGHRGLPKDVARGLALLEAAADRGDAAAALHLGNIHFRGRHGVPRSPDRAMQFYRRAADLGCPAAQANVGSALLATNPTEAADFLERAAAQGQPYARATLTRLRGGAPPPPLAETFADFVATPLDELARRAPDDDGARELDIEVTGETASLTAAIRALLVRLDARWPRLDVGVEVSSEPLDFPGEHLPGSVFADGDAVELSLRPNGDTRYSLTLSSFEAGEWSLALRSSEPHPADDEWRWIVSILDASLRTAGLGVRPA